MKNDKLSFYYQARNEAIAEFGLNPIRVADAIIAKCFPDTVNAADREGCLAMFRGGLIAQLKNEFKHMANAEENRDPSQLELYPESIRPIVPRLSGTAHYVESLGMLVPNRQLFASRELLDDARKFKRKKGEETLKEADVLDEIYSALYGSDQPATAE